MEVIKLRPDAPNLDGDYKTLLKIVKNKKPNTEAIVIPLETKPNEKTLQVIPEEGTNTCSLRENEKLEAIKKQMILSVEDDDIHCMKDIIDELKNENVLPSDEKLYVDKEERNILHLALSKNSDRVAKYLIEEYGCSDTELLCHRFKLEVAKIHTTKTSLHYLAEKGDLQMFMNLLNNVPNGADKDDFIKAEVIMEPAGQRPRPLAAIHIAALNGHTDILKYLTEVHKVSIDTVNNKDDTPVLWAARNNHIETVRYLMSIGADLMKANDKKSTPLYWAVRYEYPKLVSVIINESKHGFELVRQKRSLGLVLPIILASAYGFLEIVTILCNFFKKTGTLKEAVNEEGNNGQTALHYAAAVGHSDIVEYLLQNEADIEKRDDSGNTPMLVAVKAGCISGDLHCVKTLIKHGANMHCKNELDETVWDFAMNANNNELLTIMINMYKYWQTEYDAPRDDLNSSGKMTFPRGRTPLHAAVSKGDFEKLLHLLEMGASPESEDQHKNTFFHVAARENQVSILEKFIQQDMIDLINDEDDTALHLAVRNGHERAVEILLRKAKLDAVNVNGDTALHVAATSHLASAKITELLVKTIVNTTNYATLNKKNKAGNTALHIAAMNGRVGIISALEDLNPMVKNNSEETPFHIAAKNGIPDLLEEMIEVFDKPQNDIDINVRDKFGETILHLCAKIGDSERVHLIVTHGGDLSLNDKDGNTILHDIVEHSVHEPNKTESLINVYHDFTDTSVIWWVMQDRNVICPERGTVEFEKYKRIAMIYLTSEITNIDGLNVIQYATSLGATRLLYTILNTPGVYKIREKDHWLFDVTYIAPELMPGLRHKRINSVIPEKRGNKENETNKYEICSGLELAIRLKNMVVATRVLDTAPICYLVADYWTVYRWVYGLLMIIHIIYMSLYTAYCVPLLLPSARNNTTIQSRREALYFLFLVWPFLFLVIQFFFFIMFISRVIKRYAANLNTFKSNEEHRTSETTKSRFQLLTITAYIFHFFKEHISTVATLVFPVSVFVWYFLYLYASDNEVYIVSIVLIIGWIYTIIFTKGFQTVHAFSTMIYYIIIRDISRFLFIYSFILLGFSLAFWAFFHVIPDLISLHASPFSVMFLTFNMMLGMDNMFTEEFNHALTTQNRSSDFTKFIYIFFICLSTIIFLNLLVAMMTDTYTDIKSKEGTTWRVGSVRLALQMEKNMPWLRNTIKKVTFSDQMITENKGRFHLKIPINKVKQKDQDDVDVIKHTIQRLEAKTDAILLGYEEMSTRMVERNSGQGTTNFTRPVSANRFRKFTNRRSSMYPVQQ